VRCSGRLLLWCKVCCLFWCVPGVCADGVPVFHAGCPERLEPLQGVGEDDKVARAVVCCSRTSHRLEVRVCDGRWMA
jgi:hypothetical protein